MGREMNSETTEGAALPRQVPVTARYPVLVRLSSIAGRSRHSSRARSRVARGEVRRSVNGLHGDRRETLYPGVATPPYSCPSLPTCAGAPASIRGKFLLSLVNEQ
jgi:hypothetical protein